MVLHKVAFSILKLVHITVLTEATVNMQYWHCEEYKKKSILLPTVVFVSSVQSGGRGLVSTQCCPQFLHFEQTQKEFKLHTDCSVSGISGQTKPSQQFGQVAEFKTSSLSPSSSPCLSSGNHFQRQLFQNTIEGFDCKINGWALGAAPRHSLGCTDRQAPTQGFS